MEGLMRGLERARKRSYERAARFGLKVALFKEGSVVFIDPAKTQPKEKAATKLEL